MLRRRTRIFLTLSVVLFLMEVTFVVLNHDSAYDAMRDSLETRGEAAVQTFRVGMELTEDNMLQMATFVGNNPRVENLFRKGAAAVEREGGNDGGSRASQYRRALYQEVRGSWRELKDLFGFRQLHFHLPPGSTSFLRVHRPEKFGDTMHGLRHTVATVNGQRKPVTGFETGRIYSGVRGVAPVTAPSPQGPTFVGALEVGTSFQQLLNRVGPRIGGEIAIFLDREHVERSMWPEAVEDRFGPRQPRHGYFEEATTGEGLMDFVGRVQPPLSSPGTTTTLLRDTSQGPVAVTHAPLEDFLGRQTEGLQAVGRILIAQDASRAVAEFEMTHRENIIFAATSLLAFELLLFFGIRHLSQRLEGEVDARTKEARDLNAQLQEQAIRDPLTGLSNRRHSMEQLETEISRARRSGRPLSVAIADVDHFKAVNDTYGHAIGDEALRTLSRILKSYQRRSDLVARYGGEEFTIFMPDTGRQGAWTAMEELRKRVESTPVEVPDSEPLHQQISVGVAELQPEDTADSVLQRADLALYRAKHEGRNRVVTGKDLDAS